MRRWAVTVTNENDSGVRLVVSQSWLDAILGRVVVECEYESDDGVIGKHAPQTLYSGDRIDYTFDGED